MLLLRNTGYSAPVQRLTRRPAGGSNPYYAPSEIDMEKAILDLQERKVSDWSYVDMMKSRNMSHRKQLVAEAAAYFRAGDYLRAGARFESAEIVDRRMPTPRFGQLLVAVSQEHWRQAMHKLSKLASYDSQRGPNVEGMFEYGITLQQLYGSPDALIETFQNLRLFAQENVDNPHVQALYCYLLWYAGYPEGMVEAKSIAARIYRTHPNSPWSRFHPMLLEAERKRVASAVAAAARRGNTPATPEATRSGLRQMTRPNP